MQAPPPAPPRGTCQIGSARPPEGAHFRRRRARASGRPWERPEALGGREDEIRVVIYRDKPKKRPGGIRSASLAPLPFQAADLSPQGADLMPPGAAPGLPACYGKIWRLPGPAMLCKGASYYNTESVCSYCKRGEATLSVRIIILVHQLLKGSHKTLRASVLLWCVRRALQNFNSALLQHAVKGI